MRDDRPPYHFSEEEFRRIGKMMADRDVFFVFFYLAQPGATLDIKALAARFRRDPVTINEIVENLAALGLARKKYGLYTATGFGFRAIDFLREITEGVQPLPVEGEASLNETLVLSNGLASAATNNSVYSTFEITGYALSETDDVSKVKQGELTTESEAKNFEGNSPLPNAARPHNYL